MSRFERKNSGRVLVNNNSSYLGAIAYKDSYDQSNKRYLWIDYLSKELRWSIGLVPQNPYKKIPFSHIQSVSKIIPSPHFGFKLQTNSRILIFWLSTEKELNTWINEIANLISPNENIKIDKKRATSLMTPEYNDMQFLKFKLLQVLNPYIPNIQSQNIEELSLTIKEYLDNLINSKSEERLEQENESESKILQNQILLLQNKIKNMEEIKIQYDHYNKLEEEYNFLKGIRMDLSVKLDKVQAEKSLFSRESRLFKNELSAITAWNKQILLQTKKEKILSGQVTVNNQPKLVAVLVDLHMLCLYHPTEFTPTMEKILYSMISDIKLIEKSTILISLLNGNSLKVIGEAEFLKKIQQTYEKYQELQTDANGKILNHYHLLCEESERQLKAIEKQVKCYKKAVTVSVYLGIYL